MLEYFKKKKSNIVKDDKYFEDSCQEGISDRLKNTIRAGASRIIHALQNNEDEETDVIFIAGTKKDKMSSDFESYDVSSVRGNPESLIRLLLTASKSDKDFARIVITTAAVLRTGSSELKALDDAFVEDSSSKPSKSLSVDDLIGASDEDISKLLDDM